MTRCVAILTLTLCGWAAGCGAPATPVTVAETDSDVGWQLSVPALAYNVREGRAVFRRYCAPCHGENGRGDGFNAYNLDPKPRDIADPGFQKGRTDEELAAVVRTGGGVAGLSTAMPPWGRTLDEQQIHNLVAFMRHLPRQVEQESAE